MTSPTVDTIDLDLDGRRPDRAALEVGSVGGPGIPHRDIIRGFASAALRWISRSAASDVEERLGLEVWQ